MVIFTLDPKKGTLKAQIFPVKQKSYYYSTNSALVPRTWTIE